MLVTCNVYFSDGPVKSSKENARDKEIEDAATLLREKVAFLSGGTNEISPIQVMAIELEVSLIK